MKVAVIGAGGVGGYFGARWAEAGLDVTLLARGAHLEAINSKGLLLHSPLGDARVDVPAVGSASDVGEVDVVVVATKSWQLASLADVVEPLVGADTVVFGLQNGVDAADVLSTFVSPSRGLANVPTAVIPPATAAAVPLVRSSTKDPCRWAWGSMPPGMTSRPVASMILAPEPGARSGPISAMVSPRMRTSASRLASSLTTRPPRMRISPASCHFLRPAFGTAIPGHGRETEGRGSHRAHGLAAVHPRARPLTWCLQYGFATLDGAATLPGLR